MGQGQRATSEVRNLRDGVSAKAQEASNSMQQPGMSEGEGQIISRVAVGIMSRVDRLKAIGNGQVPAVAAAAWNLLMGVHDGE